MKIRIYGAGAISGYLGVKLARTDADRQPGCARRASCRHGLKLLVGGEQQAVRPRCTDDPAVSVSKTPSSFAYDGVPLPAWRRKESAWL